jgi:hypothetical protein
VARPRRVPDTFPPSSRTQASAMNKDMINSKTGAPHKCTDCGVAATHVCKECVKDDEEGNLFAPISAKCDTCFAKCENICDECMIACEGEGCAKIVYREEAKHYDCGNYTATLCDGCYEYFCSVMGEDQDDKSSATNSDSGSATDKDTGDNCVTCDKFCTDGNYVVTESWPGSYFCGNCYFEVSPEIRDLSDDKKDKFCKVLYKLYIE